MKISLLLAILVIPGAALQAQTHPAVGLAQGSSPSLEPSLVVRPSPQVVDPARPAKQASAAAEFPQWRGQFEGSPDFSTQIIKTQQSWSRLWRGLGHPMPQALDESREMAVFISLGTRPTGGFRLEVLSASVRDGRFVIGYSEGKPSGEMFVTQAFTQPWVIALVPATPLPVVMEER